MHPHPSCAIEVCGGSVEGKISDPNGQYNDSEDAFGLDSEHAVGNWSSLPGSRPEHRHEVPADPQARGGTSMPVASSLDSIRLEIYTRLLGWSAPAAPTSEVACLEP